jgi:hypothetical protein
MCWRVKSDFPSRGRVDSDLTVTIDRGFDFSVLSHNAKAEIMIVGATLSIGTDLLAGVCAQ